MSQRIKDNNGWIGSLLLCFTLLLWLCTAQQISNLYVAPKWTDVSQGIVFTMVWYLVYRLIGAIKLDDKSNPKPVNILMCLIACASGFLGLMFSIQSLNIIQLVPMYTFLTYGFTLMYLSLLAVTTVRGINVNKDMDSKADT